MEEKTYCYVVMCSDGTFYTGWTVNLDRRLQEHNEPNSKTKYTRTRQPVKLVYFEEFDDRSKAAQREYQIKQLNRKEKIQLVQTKHAEYQPPPVVKIPYQLPNRLKP